MPRPPLPDKRRRSVPDELNDTYEDKQYYSWDEMIADDMRDVMEFNNSLHPTRRKISGHDPLAGA
jgi:hypothetical protein